MDRSAGGDLHLHTMASDGTCSVGDRVAQAEDREFRAISITDHDVIASELETRVTFDSGVEVITGVEVRGEVDGTKVELLGYYVDPTNHELQALLERVRSNRRQRNREMLRSLRTRSTFEGTYEELSAETEGMLGRPHMAQALVEAGVVETIGRAFDRYLGPEGSAYVPMEKVPAPEVIDAIHRAGGVASLAHPGRIRTSEISTIVERLSESGLDGIEVWYPYGDAPDEGDADITVSEAAAIAEEYDLCKTGGSDCHGPDSGKFRFGSIEVPGTALDAIRARANERTTV